MSFDDWQERYELGIPEIDRDHRILFDLIGQLHDAHAAGHGVERLDYVFQVLHDYVQTHFAHEEALFAASGYAQAEPHKQAHRRFTGELDGLYRHYRAAGNPRICIELLGMLNNWWHFHVLEDDAEFGRQWRQAHPPQIQRSSTDSRLE